MVILEPVTAWGTSGPAGPTPFCLGYVGEDGGLRERPKLISVRQLKQRCCNRS